MNIPNKKVYNFAPMGTCRVEFENGNFLFYGHMPARQSTPLSMDPKYMPTLCSHAFTAKAIHNQTANDLAMNPDLPSRVVNTDVVYRIGIYELRLEVQIFNKKVTTWLNLYFYKDPVTRRPCAGKVIFSDVDPKTLKEFYEKCLM
jgi:hypothetical protein